MELLEELQLAEGHQLVCRQHSTSGALNNVDIDVYEVLDASGNLVEKITVREEMDTHFPFHERRTINRIKV